MIDAGRLPNGKRAMSWALFLLVLAPAVAIVYIVWSYRKRTATRALAQHTVDFVVCGREFEVAAVIDLESGQTPESRYKAECLKAAGIRYLRWGPLELPPSHEIAALVGDK